MTASPIPDRRSIKAASIVQAGDIHESKPGVWRVRDQAGSGTWHYVSATSCDCEDFKRNGLDCKHRLALANWSARNEPKCPTCGAPTKEDLLWCGRAMWQRFRVCQANREHKAVRI